MTDEIGLFGMDTGINLLKELVADFWRASNTAKSRYRDVVEPKLSD
jgi:hypothetical protein